jgi:hypothetical protein
MGSDLFLSYCRADRQLAEQFVRTATARGVAVWFDEHIEGGQDWRQKIVDALGSARALVILFSDHSNDSGQLIKELAVADSLRKRVIPVLISECEPRGAYLYELSSRNWINIHPDPETRLGPLVDSLIAQLDLGSGPPLPATVAAPRQPPAGSERERWFPLGRYDLYVLIPILIASFLGEVFERGNKDASGGGFSLIPTFIYLIVIGARNARLNRGVFSWQSFASYVVVSLIGLSPLIVGDRSLGLSAILGFFFLSLPVAMLANVCQATTRQLFHQNQFRSKIPRPLRT